MRRRWPVSLLAPGLNPRLHAGLLQRITGLVADPWFYVGFPAVGLGLHSIPLAIWWALPWSLVVLAAGSGGRMAGGSKSGVGCPVRRPPRP